MRSTVTRTPAGHREDRVPSGANVLPVPRGPGQSLNTAHAVAVLAEQVGLTVTASRFAEVGLVERRQAGVQVRLAEQRRPAPIRGMTVADRAIEGDRVGPLLGL